MASRATRDRLGPREVQRLTRTCVSQKVTYATEAEARIAVERSMDAGQIKEGCHLTAYRCKECGHWHVANKPVVFRMTAEDWAALPIKCAMKVRECFLCHDTIAYGQRFHAGRQSAHVACVNELRKVPVQK